MIQQLTINGIRDFNLAHIFECGQCFRWNLEDGTYVGVVGSNVIRATCEEDADYGSGLKLAKCQFEVVLGDSKNAISTLNLEIASYFDLDTDYGEIKAALVDNENKNKKSRREGEKCLADAIEYGYGIRILRQDLFETMISFIISQNNNIPRIKKCIEALCERYGESLGNHFGKERFAFPTPEALAKAEPCALADLGLGYRCEYIAKAARQFLEEGAPTTYDQVLSYLGVGPKVANCILLFGLHKVDAFPIDTWVKHIMSDMYGFSESDIRGMAKYAEDSFGRYAGYAQQYLFYYYRDRK